VGPVIGARDDTVDRRDTASLVHGKVFESTQGNDASKDFLHVQPVSMRRPIGARAAGAIQCVDDDRNARVNAL